MPRCIPPACLRTWPLGCFIGPGNEFLWRDREGGREGERETEDRETGRQRTRERERKRESSFQGLGARGVGFRFRDNKSAVQRYTDYLTRVFAKGSRGVNRRVTAIGGVQVGNHSLCV